MKRTETIAIACLLSLFQIAAVSAATISVAARPGELQHAVTSSAVGDTLVLAPGQHDGPLLIEKPLTIRGEDRHGAIVRGNAESHVIIVAATDVVIENITVTNSGDDLSTEDSGIFVTEEGDRAIIRDNYFEYNLIGVYLKGPERAKVIGNRIIGRDDLRMSETGNGIHLWNTPGSIIEGNEVSGGRDGIFVTTSRDNIFRNNQFRDLRFAIHYMYTNMSRVEGNQSIGNHMGYALMFSSHLTIRNNISEQDRDKGILLNYTTDSEITGNRVAGRPEKCLFMYNSHYNHISGNSFSACEIGVHFTAGSEENSITGNSFIGNRTQVKYVGTRLLEWSQNGVGNYWSDHIAFDRDADGIADNRYQPNSLADQIVWRHASAKVLLNSPVLQVLRWAQSQFPALHPGGVIDSAPLMRSALLEN